MIKKIYGTILSIMIIFIVSFSFSNVHAAPLESNPNWNIHFENVNIVEGSVTATTAPTINEALTEITYEIELDTPGQFYEFTADVKNSGSINAVLDEVLSTTLTTEQQRYLLYSVTYANGGTIAKNDKLDAGEKATVRVRVEFKRDITADDLPSTDSSLDLTLNLRYVQADPDSEEPEEPEQPENPEEPTEPTGDNTDNGESGNASSNTDNNNNQNSGVKPSGVQTGDSIVICFIIATLALVVLVFASKKNDKTEKK